MTFDLNRFRATLDAAHMRNDDPTTPVFDNYLRWKGVPAFLVRPVFKNDAPPAEMFVSPHFTLPVYRANPLYTTLCTLGAGYRAIPFSRASFGDERGVRYAYGMEASEQRLQERHSHIYDAYDMLRLPVVEHVP